MVSYGSHEEGMDTKVSVRNDANRYTSALYRRSTHLSAALVRAARSCSVRGALFSRSKWQKTRYTYATFALLLALEQFRIAAEFGLA